MSEHSFFSHLGDEKTTKERRLSPARSRSRAPYEDIVISKDINYTPGSEFGRHVANEAGEIVATATAAASIPRSPPRVVTNDPRLDVQREMVPPIPAVTPRVLREQTLQTQKSHTIAAAQLDELTVHLKRADRTIADLTLRVNANESMIRSRCDRLESLLKATRLRTELVARSVMSQVSLETQALIAHSSSQPKATIEAIAEKPIGGKSMT